MNIVNVICYAMCINNSMATSRTHKPERTGFEIVKHIVQKGR